MSTPQLGEMLRADRTGDLGSVEGWRQVVRSSPLAVGLLDLPSSRFVELSSAAAALLGTTPDEGISVDYLAIVEPPGDVAQTLRLLRAGVLDGTQARRRLLRADGSGVEAVVRSQAIRIAGGAELGLWIATDTSTGEDRPAVAVERLAGLTDRLAAQEPEATCCAVGTIDQSWRVARLSTEVESILGHRPAELLGSSLIDIVHPSDAADLLLTFARATTDANATERVRMRHRFGTWQSLTVAVTLLDLDAPTPFAFVLAVDQEPDICIERKRVTELEEHLQRIGAEVQGAGVLRTLDAETDAIKVPALSELSARQWEVVSRLARGERVATIAREMYVSQSTVRNHLSAVFRKLGVGSQHELLAWLRQA
jgi:PAS domain S-box-containing protein